MVNKIYVIIPAGAVAIAAVAIAFASSAANDKIDVFNDKDPRLAAFGTGSPVLGSPDAPVTLVEFGDYQCLNCNRFFHNTEDELLRNYIETGKAKMIFMDFTFIGPDSIVAAQASHCAGEQGRYWDYHDEVYSNWDGENTGWASTHNLKQFAANIGLEHKSFNECLDSGKYASKVKNNMNIGSQLGVNATPTFLVIEDGGSVQKIVGAQPYSAFSSVLDSMLE